MRLCRFVLERRLSVHFAGLVPRTPKDLILDLQAEDPPLCREC